VTGTDMRTPGRKDPAPRTHSTDLPDRFGADGNPGRRKVVNVGHDPHQCASCTERVPQVLLRARHIPHHGNDSATLVVLREGHYHRLCDWGEQ
jgi:hypothetical protein